MENSETHLLIAEGEVMKLALSRRGWRVGDGLGAVAEERDLILMDHRMPECSESEAVRGVVRELENYSSALYGETHAYSHDC